MTKKSNEKMTFKEALEKKKALISKIKKIRIDLNEAKKEQAGI